MSPITFGRPIATVIGSSTYARDRDLLVMNVAEDAGLVPGYALKLNSYDLGVDIELADAHPALRFSHPGVRALVIHVAARPDVLAPAPTSSCSGRARTRSK